MRRNDEFVLTALLSLNFGLVFLDRNALNYMMPFVAPDLKPATSQIGLLAGATALSWALSGMIFSSVSDRTGRRKRIVLIATIAFSLLSIASGFATGFLSLLLIRFALGAAEGPILPLSQAIVADEARPERRGLLMGLMNNFGSNLVGVMIAPPLLVAIAETAGWRAGFFVAGLPGLIMAVLILLLVREPERRAAIEIDAGAPRDWGALLRSRNLLLCMLISCCMLAWTILGWAFLPVQFVQGNGFAPGAMGGLMAVLGAFAVVSSILVPGLSDRIGRKPAIVLFASLGVVPPLATTFSGLDPWALAPLLFLGWTASGTLPLFMATIPAESTSPGQLATAMALVMGVGEVIGGAVMPVVAGFAGDGHGLVAVMMIQAACAVLAALIALFLIETAPFRRHRPAAA